MGVPCLYGICILSAWLCPFHHPTIKLRTYIAFCASPSPIDIQRCQLLGVRALTRCLRFLEDLKQNYNRYLFPEDKFVLLSFTQKPLSCCSQSSTVPLSFRICDVNSCAPSQYTLLLLPLQSTWLTFLFFSPFPFILRLHSTTSLFVITISSASPSS